jgi:hypothetical protein
MINFFTLILLALLILLKIILVTAIFNNVVFKDDEKNYKTKALVRDIFEAILLVCVIFVLVTKYLEFVNVAPRTAYISGIVVSILTLVFYLAMNFNFLDKYYKETFKCETIGDLHSNKIKHLTDDKVFSMTPSQTLLRCSDSSIYSFDDKYPFTKGDMSNTIDHREELVEQDKPEFNNSENPNMKLLVIDHTNNDLKNVI